MNTTSLGTFGEMHRAMERVVASLDRKGLDRLLADCNAATDTNCAWYTYRAAQWVKPEVEREIEKRKTLGRTS